ncbi:MAG: nucleoside deaminase [Bacteroidota bacterium]|nr:nucleoside deaminase [Bacteroidota bacterium]MDP4258251.1 nucleoside deaminase [Bacteroidota bacterium]
MSDESNILPEPTDEHFMQQALKEARKAFDEEEVPIGAVLVIKGKIIARGHNQTERLTDPTAHAEIIALTSAFNYLGSKYLPEATIYITVEPCLMCAGALYWSKIGRVVYGADDEKNGYRRGVGGGAVGGAAGGAVTGSWPFHPKTELVKGVLKEECARLMTDFFRLRR